MKPNFALTLSFDGIGLLHRVQGGWHLVGEIGLDAGDITADLAELAAKARALDPTGLRSKLVIPDEQIKYMAFETAERDVSRIEALVREQLDGATPYALRELAWDWSVRGGIVHVAAVARETLKEAEEFALEHNFNPYCFVAMPDETAFAAEPFFGETGYAARALGSDETVEREAEIIRVIGAARLPEPQPVPPGAAPDPVAVARTGPAPKPAAAPAPATSAAETAARTIAPEPEPTAEETARTAPPKAGAGGRPGRDGGKKPKARPDTAGTIGTDDAPPVPVAFASTRDTSAAPPLDGAGRKDTLPKARFSPPSTAGKTPPATGKKAARSPAPAPEPPTFAPGPPAPSLDGAPKTPAGKPGKSAGAAIGAFLSRRKSARTGKPDAVTAAPVPGHDAPATEPQPLVSSGTLDEAQRMTVFGARRGDDAALGKPRHLALVLTVLLLLFLVAVAAWSALVLDDGLSGLFRSEDPVQTAGDTDQAEDVIAAEEPLVMPPQAEAGAPPEETPAPEIVAPPALTRAETVPEELPADEVRARYAATGIWQMAPDPPAAPGTTSRRDVYRIEPDERPVFAALPALPGTDALLPSARPPTPGVPPSPQARFDLDPRGFIAATPEGTVTPDGITVIAGAPPIRPPPTPPRASAQVLDDPAAAAPSEPGLRPRLRPASLTGRADDAGTDAETGAEADGDTPAPEPQNAIERALQEATEESSLRPKPRPASFASRVEQAREAAASEPVHADQRISVPIPSTASVARAATERNLISLRKVNLIGVYGSPGERRALIRLANGKYRKVQVGDQLDGGQVAAIGDDELHYIKRGRAVVLKMPRG